MSHIADAADSTVELFLNVAINAKRDTPAQTNNPSGECWHCEEETGTERRWCSPECRDDWEKENE